MRSTLEESDDAVGRRELEFERDGAPIYDYTLANLDL